jgi:hypothetical protein
VVVHLSGELLQLSSGRPQSIGAIAAHIRHHFVIDVLKDAAQIFFHSAACLVQTLLPRTLWRFTHGTHLSTVDYRDEENAWSMQLQPFLSIVLSW